MVTRSEFNAWRKRVIIGYLVLLLGAGYAIVKVEDTASTAAVTARTLAGVVAQQKEATTNQLNNRVANVATWCGAINEGRDEARTRSLQGPPGTPPFRLHDLDCKALEAKTAQSSTSKEAATVRLNLKATPW